MTGNNVSIYPIPSNGIVNIGAGNTIKSVQLTDMRGRKLQSALANDSVDISAYPNGIYLLRIVTDKGMKVQKVVKE